ncbi:methyltransferase [Leucobacter viscericola]|uniref:Methyltransferase n=1 Tax=Leucobacter viscericola TaxID=2714935 RepID=A0A6G7XJQ1_9MICO|nr:methyltransferase [Leucobacter viscericola]
MEAIEALFAQLSREPDLDAPELQAHDSADTLLLRTAAAELNELGDGELVVIGDRHGALTLGAASLFGVSGIRTHQDPLLGERALARNAEHLGLADSYTNHLLDERLLEGARVVLMQLPRGLDALDEIADAIARYAAPGVRVFAGGRVKHMTRAMNEVLGRSFTEVQAGLGWRKARVLTANGARALETAPFPRWASDPDLNFELAAFGATFGGPTLDHGSRLLLATLAKDRPQARRIVDLGCGNGVLAVATALANPGAEVMATDQSSAAVAATSLTATRAGVEDRIAVHRADGTEAIPDGWADLILLNPPFHSGSTVHTGVAHRLIRSCARALAPGGELRIVFNSSLGYRPLVERTIGPTQQLARDRTFTVLAAQQWE